MRNREGAKDKKTKCPWLDFRFRFQPEPDEKKKKKKDVNFFCRFWDTPKREKEGKKEEKEGKKGRKKLNIFYLCSAHNTQHRHKETRGIGERRENRTKGTDLESCEGNRMKVNRTWTKKEVIDSQAASKEEWTQREQPGILGRIGKTEKRTKGEIRKPAKGIRALRWGEKNDRR